MGSAVLTILTVEVALTVTFCYCDVIVCMLLDSFRGSRCVLSGISWWVEQETWELEVASLTDMDTRPDILGVPIVLQAG